MPMTSFVYMLKYFCRVRSLNVVIPAYNFMQEINVVGFFH